MQMPQVQLEGDIENGLELKIWINEEATQRLLPLLCSCPDLPEEETCRCYQSVQQLFTMADSKDFKAQPLHLQLGANSQFELRTMKGTNVIGILAGAQQNMKE